MKMPSGYYYARPAEYGNRIPIVSLSRAKRIAKTYRGGGNYRARVVPYRGKYTVIIKGI